MMDAHGVDGAMAIPFPVVEDYRSEHDRIRVELYNRSGMFLLSSVGAVG